MKYLKSISLVMIILISGCVSVPKTYSVNKAVNGVDVAAKISYMPRDYINKVPAHYTNLIIGAKNTNKHDISNFFVTIGFINNGVKVGESIAFTSLLKAGQPWVFNQPAVISYPFNKLEIVKTQGITNESPDDGRIGVFLSKKLAIIKIIEGSSAEDNGLRIADKIITVSSVDVTDDLESAIMLLRGKKGTNVSVVIERKGQLITFFLQRK